MIHYEPAAPKEECKKKEEENCGKSGKSNKPIIHSAKASQRVGTVCFNHRLAMKNVFCLPLHYGEASQFLQ